MKVSWALVILCSVLSGCYSFRSKVVWLWICRELVPQLSSLFPISSLPETPPNYQTKYLPNHYQPAFHKNSKDAINSYKVNSWRWWAIFGNRCRSPHLLWICNRYHMAELLGRIRKKYLLFRPGRSRTDLLVFCLLILGSRSRLSAILWLIGSLQTS